MLLFFSILWLILIGFHFLIKMFFFHSKQETGRKIGGDVNCSLRSVYLNTCFVTVVHYMQWIFFNFMIFELAFIIVSINNYILLIIVLQNIILKTKWIYCLLHKEISNNIFGIDLLKYNCEIVFYNPVVTIIIIFFNFIINRKEI